MHDIILIAPILTISQAITWIQTMTLGVTQCSFHYTVLSHSGILCYLNAQLLQSDYLITKILLDVEISKIGGLPQSFVSPGSSVFSIL